MTETPPPPEPDVSEASPESDHWVWAGAHRPPIPRALVEQMTRDWATPQLSGQQHPAVAYNADRRARLSAEFPGRSLVVSTGGLKVRSNDTDFRYRPGSDFYWLTACPDPDAVLLLRATPDGHQPTLYVEPRGDRSSHKFFTDLRYGELWTGPRRGVKETAAYLDIPTAPLSALEEDLAGLADVASTRGVDERIDALIPESDADPDLQQRLNDLRLIKDDFEIAMLQKAVDATVRGFADVVRALPEAMEHGERVVEGIFNMRARVEGNDVGYGTIAASGRHATILHWTGNDGPVQPGDLLLLDAGVESRELYTADITRTLPVSGRFSPEQRQVYELVLAAQRAALGKVKPGARFTDPHDAAMLVLAQGLHDLGIMAEDPEVAVQRHKQLHRRYTLHGTSHMLGLDVHDCAHARNEHYVGGELRAGYVLTIEPGLYFQANDLTVPERYRGIGVRIEDDVLVTEDGYRVLSAALPTDPDEIEAWMRSVGYNQAGESRILA